MSDRKRILASPHPVFMSFLLLAWAFLGPAVSAQESPALPAPDSGVFEILSNNQHVGTEKFEIRPNASGWVASGELQLQAASGRTSETCSLTLNNTPYPTFYERIQKSPHEGKLVVQFGPTETVLEMTAGEAPPYQQVFLLPKADLAVLDTNFFHQYTFLLRLYDHAKGDAQSFNVFIPQEALPGTVNLKYLSKETVPVGNSTAELDHYQVVTDELEMEIWATSAGAIQRISIPEASLEVVRQ